MTDKKKVTGLGGIFFKSDNPANLREWYNKHLGINAGNYGAMFEWLHTDAPERKGTTVWNPFKKESDYFAPSDKQFMFNFMVEDLEWLLGELKKEGIEMIGEMQVYEYGKFAHLIDPEGNKIELWEPAKEE